MTAILKYDEACRALSEAKSFDEVQDWIDKAAAIREYGRRIRNRQLEIDAIEIRARAKRRRGELLRDLDAAGLLRRGPVEKVTRDGPIIAGRMTLEELGISKNESSEEQKIAAIPADSYERLIARCRAELEREPKKHALDVLRAPGDHVSNARAQMASRLEIRGDLDFYPTPLWGTRALFEHVLPTIGVDKVKSAWEPACGQGHMSTVMQEYVTGEMLASDVFDYSGGDALLQAPGWWQIFDFLLADQECPSVDWIISNPPFDYKALEFTLLALARANVGVAIFVPLRWLETKDRYERLFSVTPPTVVAPFVERINLCKGRWEPNGGTATAYCWIVWKHKAKPRAIFWIPPICKETLTHPDDAKEWGHEVPATDGAGEIIEHDSDGEILSPPITSGEHQKPKAEMVRP